MNVEIDYDLDSKEYPEGYDYPNPSEDWFVIIRVPAKPDWTETQKDAQAIRDRIKEVLK